MYETRSNSRILEAANLLQSCSEIRNEINALDSDSNWRAKLFFHLFGSDNGMSTSHLTQIITPKVEGNVHENKDQSVENVDAKSLITFNETTTCDHPEANTQKDKALTEASIQNLEMNTAEDAVKFENIEYLEAEFDDGIQRYVKVLYIFYMGYIIVMHRDSYTHKFKQSFNFSSIWNTTDENDTIPIKKNRRNKSEAQIFGCSACPSFSTNFKWNAKRHIKEQHGYLKNDIVVKKLFVCSICKTSNSNKANFKEHAKSCGPNAHCIEIETNDFNV